MFEEPQKIIVLEDFPGEYAGLEVRCRARVPFGVLLDINRGESAKSAAEVEAALRKFGDEILVEWNMALNGKPLPATGEGFAHGCSSELQQLIIHAWMVVATGVPGPLGATSNDGRSPEVPMPPMVTL
jgi:hypothetical protein